MAGRAGQGAGQGAGVSALLEVRGLAKSYGGVKAVADVSLSLEAGEIVALIGPNGAGKSTCFNMLNGQIRPDSGTDRAFGPRHHGAARRARSGASASGARSRSPRLSPR